MKRLTLALGLVALAAVLAACSGANAEQAEPTGSIDPNAAVIVARDLEFSPQQITVAAGAPFQLVLDNQEGVPHNIAITDPTGAKVFAGEIVSNAKVTNQVPALAAATYTFLCEVHPNMTGTLVVQ